MDQSEILPCHGVADRGRIGAEPGQEGGSRAARAVAGLDLADGLGDFALGIGGDAVLGRTDLALAVVLDAGAVVAGLGLGDLGRALVDRVRALRFLFVELRARQSWHQEEGEQKRRPCDSCSGTSQHSVILRCERSSAARLLLGESREGEWGRPVARAAAVTDLLLSTILLR